MHETAVIRGLVRKLCELVKQQGASGVEKLNVTLGALSHFTPEHFRRHLEIETRDTVLENVEVICRQSTDINDPNANGVTVNQVTLILPDYNATR